MDIQDKSHSFCPFFTQLAQRQDVIDSLLCVGLDPDLHKFPDTIKNSTQSVREKIFAFNRAIIDATAEFTSAYKPQSAFFEGQGIEGIQALFDTMEYLKKTYPDIPVILDAKRGDIGSTNAGYLSFAFDELQADAVTVNPYLGKEAMLPFLQRADKASIVLIKTSNLGSGEFQDLPVDLKQLSTAYETQFGNLNRLQAIVKTTTLPFYQVVAFAVAQYWNTKNNLGMVVGATYPEELQIIRTIVGEDVVFLIPGLGAQGGSIKDSLVGLNSQKKGAILSASRSILYASNGDDFAQAAEKEAKRLKEEINKERYK